MSNSFNFENHKKQAKQILKWHKERHWPVAEQIRTALPEFSELSDREILDHEFKLADAQLVVAKRAGFSSWAELKDNGDALDIDPDVGTPRLNSALPMIYVSDIDRACDYYERVLGFEIAFKYGDPPFYGQIERDHLRMSLRALDDYILKAQRTRRREEEIPAATFMVTAIKSLYQEFVDAGAIFFQPLRTEPWGAKGFIVEDPDENLLIFSADTVGNE